MSKLTTTEICRLALLNQLLADDIIDLAVYNREVSFFGSCPGLSPGRIKTSDDMQWPSPSDLYKVAKEQEWIAKVLEIETYE